MRTLIAAYICAALVLIACGHAAPPMPVTPIMAIDSRSVDSSTITLVPSHVMLATYGTTSYGGTSSAVPISYQCAHDTWVYQGAETAAYESAGCKVMLYTQVWRAYMAKTTAEDVVNNTDLTITNALALAKSCNGKVLSTTAYGGTVYLMDPRSSRAASHFDNVVNYEWGARGVYPDALFLDNTAANADFSGLCDYSYSTWINAVKTVAGSSAHPAFMNLLNAWLNGGTPAGNVAAESPNVLGGMCESCYLNNAGVVSGTNWQRQEQGEIASIQAHKIFWAYARNTTAANSSTGQALRMYGYASFLLTYDPQYTMYQTALYTPSAFPIMPEFGLVPEGPLQTYSTVSGYLHGSVYMRQYKDCYFNSKRIGSCAVVVNPSSAAQPIPVSYPNSLTLSGGGIYENGTVGFRGPKMTSVAADSAAILIGL